MPYLNKTSLYIIMREDECWYRKSWGLMPYLNKTSLFIIMREDECWYRKSWGVNAIS